MISAADEGVHAPTDLAFSESVTISFADPDAGLCGLARLGIVPGGDGRPRQGSALVLLYEGRDTVVADAEGGVELGADADWERVAVAGLEATTRAPLAAWELRYAAGEHAFALELEALTAPAELAAEEPVARAGGLAGYEQVCRIRGTVSLAGHEYVVDALGQRGHLWGAPDWSAIALTRSLSAWFAPGDGIALAAVRPAGVTQHEGEARWGVLLGADAAVPIGDPRLSTTYDGEGRQRRAGLELWVHDDDGQPHRAAGEVVCGSSLVLGSLRLDCAFLVWRLDGRVGVGRYDIIRPA